MAHPAGTRLGPYEIVSFIGAGSNASGTGSEELVLKERATPR
jgi:hypothetical protein